jgi:uncharacterized protein (DUF433 family)
MAAMFSEEHAEEHFERRRWRRLTLEELAALADVSPGRVRKELEENIVPKRREGSAHLVFGPRDVFYFRLVKHVEGDGVLTLNKRVRRALHAAIMHIRPANDNVELTEPLWRKTGLGWELTAVQGWFDARQPFAETMRNVRLFVHGKRRLVSRPDVLGGEPVFKGTRIAARHVGDLVKKGVPHSELKEDFPFLNDEDLTFAALFASLPRPPGRPRKALVVRRERT